MCKSVRSHGRPRRLEFGRSVSVPAVCTSTLRGVAFLSFSLGSESSELVCRLCNQALHRWLRRWCTARSFATDRTERTFQGRRCQKVLDEWLQPTAPPVVTARDFDKDIRSKSAGHLARPAAGTQLTPTLTCTSADRSPPAPLDRGSAFAPSLLSARGRAWRPPPPKGGGDVHACAPPTRPAGEPRPARPRRPDPLWGPRAARLSA